MIDAVFEDYRRPLQLKYSPNSPGGQGVIKTGRYVLGTQRGMICLSIAGYILAKAVRRLR
jgi:hypothetical protein